MVGLYGSETRAREALGLYILRAGADKLNTLQYHVPEEAQHVSMGTFEYQVKEKFKSSRLLSRAEVGRCAVFTQHSFTSRIASIQPSNLRILGIKVANLCKRRGT